MYVISAASEQLAARDSACAFASARRLQSVWKLYFPTTVKSIIMVLFRLAASKRRALARLGAARELERWAPVITHELYSGRTFR